MAGLFRPEAIENVRQRLYGELVVTLPVTHWGVTGLIALAILLLCCVLIFGTYARKETVGGWVRPDRGVVRVQTSDEGVVESVAVAEGDDVAAGAPLLSIRLDADMAKGEAFGERMRSDLDSERSQLQEQFLATESQFAVRASRLRAELASLEGEVKQYSLQMALYERRIVLAEKQVEQRASLVRQGFVSKLDAEKLEDALLASRQSKEEQTQQMLVRQHRVQSAQYELAALPHEKAVALAAIGERKAALEQRATEAGRRMNRVLSAPVAGRVAAVRVEVGETAKAKSYLIDILPQGAQMQAELFAPSRAAGFLNQGSEVQLRYDAFPYQKFGVGKGRIVRISRTTMDARDLPRAIAADEPVYRVIVALDRDNVVAEGKELLLQSGMTLKADVILERRSVGEFLFEPLLAIARR
jgi:membrane fusion protein